MEIKNTSKFKYEDLMKHMNTNPIPGMKKIKWLLIAYALLLAALLILYLTGARKTSSLVILIILSGLFIVLFALYAFFPRYYRKVSIKNSQDFVKGVTYYYTFKDETFIIEANMRGQKASAEIAYSSLYMTKLTEAILFLHINKSSFYMVKCDGFVKGERKLVLEKLQQFVKRYK